MATTDEARHEAGRIARALINTLAMNRRPRNLGFLLGLEERYKGVWCYDWAYGLEDAFDLESSGDFFDAVVEGSVTQDGSGRMHLWLRIEPVDGGKAVFVDDSFG